MSLIFFFFPVSSRSSLVWTVETWARDCVFPRHFQHPSRDYLYTILSVSRAIVLNHLRREMFTPVEASVGALILGQATTTLLLNNGRVLGASSIMAGSFLAPTLSNIPIIAGMGLSALGASTFTPRLLPKYDSVNEIFGSWTWVLAGLVVGMGAKV